MKKRTLGIFTSIFAVVAIVALAFDVASAPGNQPPLQTEVTNWPIDTAVNVWWYRHLNSGGTGSSNYNANGFGQLHVLMFQVGLEASETVRFVIHGACWNGTHTSYVHLRITEIILDEDNPAAAITIPVPSDEFSFTVATDYECRVSLSFYLTWA